MALSGTPLHTLCAALLCLSPLGVSTGCWRANRLDPPDLTTQRQVVEVELERQRAVLTVMRRDLDRLGSLTSELFTYPTSAYARPFPLQTFTLTLVSCFNEPMITPAELMGSGGDELPDGVDELDEPESPVQASARRFGVTCQPAALPVLERKLDVLVESGIASAPTLYTLTREQLARVESIRVLRHRLHTRQTAIRPLIRDARALLDAQRGAWQRLANGVDSRKLDYTPANLAIARKRLRAQQDRLSELEGAIKALNEAHTSWPEEMAQMLDELVYELAWIGRS